MTDLRAQFLASLAITPTEAERTMRFIRAKQEVRTAAHRIIRALNSDKMTAVFHWAEHQALWLMVIRDHKEIDVLQATLSEVSSPAIAKELERRAKEGETPAVRAEATRILKRLGKIAQPKSVESKRG